VILCLVIQMRRSWLLFTTVLLIQNVVFGDPTQTTFEFHNGFWVNLHHTLYHQAAGKKAGRTSNLSMLTTAEATAWSEALDYYERNLTEHDLLEFSMIRINGGLAAAGDAPSLKGSEAPKLVVRLLEKIAPVYRAHWWTEHNRKNHEWIDQVTPLIAMYEKTLRPALSHAYNTPWPKDRIRVEMSYYTTGKSAYTSLRPTLITISSWSPRNVGPAGLETIFHEAGHGLVQEVIDEISAAENRSGRKLSHQDLWHAVIFYTTGELVRRHVPVLVPYAMKHGMWENAWPNFLPLMEKHWKPFLDGSGRFEESIDQLVADAN
jgi:hypothetical protein